MKNLLVALLFSLTATVSFAKDKAPTRDIASEVESEECNDDSTAGMLQCDSQKMITVRKNLATILKKIRFGMRKNGEEPKELVSRLYQSHTAFHKYAAAECRLRSAEMLGGSGERVIFAGCYLDMMTKHLADLKEVAGTYIIE